METDTSSATAEVAPGTEEAPDAATASPETSQEGSVEGEHASETAEETAARLGGKDDSAKPPAPAKAKLKLKDREWDEDELLKRVDAADKADEHFRSAAQRHAEAQKLKAQTEQVFEALVKDPVGTLRYLRSKGLLTQDVEDMAEQVLRDATEDATLTPEQKQARDERRELDRLRGEAKQRNEQEQTRQATARQEQFEKQLDLDMKSVFDEAGIPKTLYQMRRVGANMLALHEQGVPYSKEVIQHAVRQSIAGLKEEVSYLADNMSAEQLVKSFPNLAAKLRKAAVAQVLGQQKGVPPTAATVGRAPGTKPPPPKTAAAPTIKSFKDFHNTYLTPEQ